MLPPLAAADLGIDDGSHAAFVGVVFLALTALGYFYCRQRHAREDYARVRLYEDRPFAYTIDEEEMQAPYATPVTHMPHGALESRTPHSAWTVDEADVQNVQSLIQAELADTPGSSRAPRR